MLAAPPSSPVQKKILVIDGDTCMRHLIATGFTTGWPGSVVEEAADQAQGQAKLLSGGYDLVVVGSVLADPYFLRMAEQAQTIPVLVISGESALTLQLENAGFPHLAKPFVIDDLLKDSQAAMADFRDSRARVRAALNVAKVRIAGLAAREGDAASGCGACRNAASLPPLTMAFQPIIDLAAQRIDGHEALVRGLGGEGAGQVLASLTPENRYAFDQACRVTAIEMAARLGLDCDLHINFMPNAIYDPVACLRPTLAAARRTGFAHERLVFEVMEEPDVSSAGHLAAIVAAHRGQKFKLALDDFGAGFSGLARLAALAPDIIKLDRALIGGCDGSSVRLEIVASMVGLCRRLGVKLIAEGVETAEELAALRKLGVNFVQGFYFARPAFQALVAREEIVFAGPA
jgi:EAL domain-containing protein (putative c-di-GMP-specific phosphodiesterase class I)